MMESDYCTTSTSTDGADGPTLIKEEPNEDGLKAVLCFNQCDKQLSSQQNLSDHNLEDGKDDIPIINITPIVVSDACASKPAEDNLTMKSEADDNYNSTKIPSPTSDYCEVVPNVVPNLYEVKNEVACPIHGKIVHNNRLDAGSELVEVKGELDCKPNIGGNVDIPGDVSMQLDEQCTDTVKEEPPRSMEICEVDVKEKHTLGE